MKQTLSLLLTLTLLFSLFSLSAFAFYDPEEAEDNSTTTIEVSDLAGLKNAIETVNAAPDATYLVKLTADIAVNEEITPFYDFKGTFDGNGKTITGLSKTVLITSGGNYVDNGGKIGVYHPYRWTVGTKDAAGAFADSVAAVQNYRCYGYIGFAALFVKVSGTVKNLTVSGGTMSVEANFNKNNRMDVAYLAAYAENAVFDNVKAEGITVKTVGTTINENQGDMGYAAVLCARSTGTTVFKNCSVDAASTVSSAAPRIDGAQILGTYDGDTTGGYGSVGSVEFENCTASGSVTLCQNAASVGQMYTAGLRTDGVAGTLYKGTIGEGTVYYGKTLEDSDGFDFYYQTRVNAADSTQKDYRVICIADKAKLEGKSRLTAKITFTNGSASRAITLTTDTVYYSVVAVGNETSDIYHAAEGDVCFGWIITAVPADYQNTAPTAVIQ